MARIAIDAGHGLNTAGKRCLKKLDANETREWVLNDRVADALAVYLKNAGHTICRVDDTDGSTDVALSKRVKIANEWNADFYISVHHNAGIKGGTGGGTVVYAYKKGSDKSFEAQKAIYNHAIERGDLKGNRSNGTPTANYYVIKYTKMPSCLIECGFMDSATDIKYILDPEWSKKIALGIAEGICEVFGGKVSGEVVSDGESEAVSGDFRVKVLADSLNIRKGAGVGFDIVGAIEDNGVYTIVDTAQASNGSTWGLLKAYKQNRNGWINISEKYVSKL